MAGDVRPPGANPSLDLSPATRVAELTPQIPTPTSSLPSPEPGGTSGWFRKPVGPGLRGCGAASLRGQGGEKLRESREWECRPAGQAGDGARFEPAPSLFKSTGGRISERTSTSAFPLEWLP